MPVDVGSPLDHTEFASIKKEGWRSLKINPSPSSKHCSPGDCIYYTGRADISQIH